MTAKILQPKNPDFASVLSQALEASPVVRFFGFELSELPAEIVKADFSHGASIGRRGKEG